MTCLSKVSSHFNTTDFTDLNQIIKSYHINHLVHTITISIVKTFKGSNKAKTYDILLANDRNKNVKSLKKTPGLKS